MRPEASSPVLIRTSVYERVRGEILSCALRPGAMLQERDLAERYQVSKSPVRDALLRLEEQSLVEVMPRKGYRVKPVSIADAHEMYEMRHILEKACVTRLIEAATDATVKALERLARTRRQASLPDWIEYNRRFHLALAESCGNARLARATAEVIEQFDRLTYMSVATDAPVALGRFVEEHVEIVAAIKRREKRAAAALVTEHIDSSRKRLLERLECQAIIA